MAYAVWRKCDFQIHTPRDPNWTGSRPIGVGEILPSTRTAATGDDVDRARQAWAADFVIECTKRSLQAIAITDHHEMIMVSYVQREIATRKAADPSIDLWLFPGMELTASGGKQCLVIFDAELSEDWRKQAQGKLGIVFAGLDEKAAKAPKVTQVPMNYADIAAEINKVEALKGRFIILPNVSQGGKHTVLVDKAHTDFRRMNLALTEAESAWEEEFKAARLGRDTVLAKLSAHQTAASQIIRLHEEATEVTNEIGQLEAEIQSQGDPSTSLRESLEALRNLRATRTARTNAWAQQIEQLSNAKIAARVDPMGDTSDIRDALDALASKTGSQEASRLKAIDDSLKTTGALQLLDQLRSECLALLHWRLIGAASGEEEPAATLLFKFLGDTDRIRASFLEKLDAARIEAISVALPTPKIALFYNDDGRVIAFEKASEGQRAAALLFMLLEQPGGPLIIDQPEGDLDNKVIAALTDKLHTAKQNRQLIFASHNANIVVNGSSELVGYLGVDATGGRKFACHGAIETPAICGVITATMEGGEQAFKDRLDKYGY